MREAGKSAVLFQGVSRGETADLNDMLACDVFRACPPRSYDITVTQGGKTARGTFTAGMNPEEIVAIRMDGTVVSETPLAGILADRFGTDAARKTAAQQELAARKVDAEARALAWQAYKAAPTQQALKAEWDSKIVTTPERSSPYLWRHVGTKPLQTAGRS